MSKTRLFGYFLVGIAVFSLFTYLRPVPARAAVNNILLEYGDYGSFSDPSAPSNPYGDPSGLNPGLYQGLRRNCVAVNFSGNTASVSVGFGYIQSSPGTTMPSSHNNVPYISYTVPFRIEIYDGSSLVGSYDGSALLSLHAEDGHISSAPVTVNPLVQALPIAQVWSGTISNAAIDNITNPRVRYIATANTPWPAFTEYRGAWRGWTQVGGTLWYANGGDWWQQSAPYQTELDSQRGNVTKQNPAWPDNSLVTSQGNQTVTYSSSAFPGCGNPAPNFNLSCSPSAASVNASAATNITLNTTAQNGFNSPVTFSTTGSLPTGVSVSYSPSNSHTPSGTTTATIQTSSNTPSGNYDITFQGSGGSVTQTCTVTLTVIGNTADFQLNISPSSRSVLAGANATYTVTVVCSGGYTGSATNLTPTSTMANVDLSFSAETLACGAQDTLTVSNTGSAIPMSAPGYDQSRTVTVSASGTGSLASQTRSVSSGLLVYAPPQAFIALREVGNTSNLATNGGTVTITSGNQVSIEWVGQNSSSCVVDYRSPSGTGTTWTTISNGPTTHPSGNAPVSGALATSRDYRVTCAGYGGSSSTTMATVAIGVPAGFDVSCTPPTYNATSGGPSFIINLATSNPVGGFSSPVTWTNSSLPSGTSVSYGNNGQVPPAVTAATFTVGNSTVAGTYPITFTATGGSQVRTCGVTLTVTNPVPVAYIAVREGTNFNNYTNGNSTNGDPAITIPYNTGVTVEWNSANATACTLSYESPRGNGTWTTVAVSGNPVNSYSLPGGNVVSPNLVQTRNYRVICTGPGGTSAPAIGGVNVVPPAINPPSTVSLAVGASCGTIDVSWTAPSGGTYDGYRVYRSLDGSSWQQVGSDLSSSTFSYTDTSPLSQTQGNYYAVVAYRTSDSAQSSYGTSTPSAVQPVVCSGDLSLSDKDLTLANGASGAVPSAGCNATSDLYQFSNGRVFKVGDVATFRLCLKNSGPVTVTGVSLSDVGTNISNYSNFSYGVSCGTVVKTDTPAGFDLTLGNLGPGVSCQITFRATVTAPSNPDPTLYRFQNVAVLRGTSAGNLLTQTLRTPLYPFATTNGTPTRGEIAP